MRPTPGLRVLFTLADLLVIPMHRTAPEDTASTRILRALSLRPGANPAQLSRLVDRSRNAVDHALHELVRARAVVDHGTTQGHHYFLPDSGAGLKHTLPSAALHFIQAIDATDGATGQALAKTLGVSRSEISRLGLVLSQQQLIVAVRRGRDVLYLPVAS